MVSTDVSEIRAAFMFRVLKQSQDKGSKFFARNVLQCIPKYTASLYITQKSSESIQVANRSLFTHPLYESYLKKHIVRPYKDPQWFFFCRTGDWEEKRAKFGGVFSLTLAL